MRSFASSCILAIFPFGIGLFAQSQNRCRMENLPVQAQGLIRKTFPGWRIKLVSDLESYDKQLWEKAHPKDCPGLAIGHFRTADQTDYALLLVPNEGVNDGSKIFVLTKSERADTYSLKVLDHAEQQPGSSSGLVISKVPPGKYSSFDTTQSVTLKADGIEAEWLEQSSILYYWKNGRYRKLQTSD